jgi:hypothetical protein
MRPWQSAAASIGSKNGSLRTFEAFEPLRLAGCLTSKTPSSRRISKIGSIFMRHWVRQRPVDYCFENSSLRTFEAFEPLRLAGCLTSKTPSSRRISKIGSIFMRHWVRHRPVDYCFENSSLRTFEAFEPLRLAGCLTSKTPSSRRISKIGSIFMRHWVRQRPVDYCSENR